MIPKQASPVYTSSGILYVMPPEVVAQLHDSEWLDLVEAGNLEGAHLLVPHFGGSILREPTSGTYNVETVAKWASRTAAQVGTDTATIYAIAPEMLHHIIEKGEWKALADAMWDTAPRRTSRDMTMDTWEAMGRLIREHGGAVFSTGGDGSWDVNVTVKDGHFGRVEGKGYLPPYGTPAFGKVAAMHLAKKRVTSRYQMRVVLSRLKQAGWWQVAPGGKGGIWWGSEDRDKTPEADRRYHGDGPADMALDFFDKVDLEYRRAWDRPMYPEEMQATFDFFFGLFREKGTESKHWPLNPWVDAASKLMNVPNSVILSLPESSIEDAERLWREYQNAKSFKEHPPMIVGPGVAQLDPEDALRGFLEHVRAACQLHWPEAKRFVEAIPEDRIPDYIKGDR